MKPFNDARPKGEAAQRVMAIALEGTLRSAFADRSAPGISAPAESLAPVRLLVVSSSQFLANPFARAGNPPPGPPQMAMMGPIGGDETLQTLSRPYAQRFMTGTILAFKDTLDWMGVDADRLACSTLDVGPKN